MRRTTFLRAAAGAAGMAAAATCLAALAVSLAGCASAKPDAGSASPTPSPSPSPIRLGAIYSLTGSQEALDGPSLDGARLAVDRINAQGGLLGRRVELLEWDGQSDPAAARRAAQSLAYAHVVAMIGLSDTDQVLAAAPVAARAHIPFVTSGATSPLLPSRVPRWLFLACFGDNVQAAAGAEYAVNTLRAHRAAVLFDEDMEYTQQLQRYFVRSFRAQGGSVVLRRGFHSGDRNVGELLARPAGSGEAGEESEEGEEGEEGAQEAAKHRIQADLLYIAAGPDDTAPLVRKLRAAGYRQPIMGGDSYDDPALIAAAAATGGRVWFTTHAALGVAHSTAAMRRFTVSYRLAYGRAPENAFAGLGYDTVNLVAAAITAAGSTAPDALLQGLRETHSYDGVTGEIRYANGSRVPGKQVTIVYVGSRPEVAAQLVPHHVPTP